MAAITVNNLRFELFKRTKEAHLLNIAQGCKNQETYDIPEKVTDKGVEYVVTHILEEAFSDTKTLTSIVIPKTVTSIGNYAFSGCHALTSIVIPNSVIHIGRGVLACCTSLASVEVESSNKVYDGRNNCNAIIETATNKLIAGCKSTTLIPDGVKVICSSAFSGCSSLASITIPNSVTTIGDNAFSGCSALASITIPKSVIMIRSGAFNGCNSLKQHPIKEIEIGQLRYRLLLNNQNAIVIGASSKNIHSIEIPEEIAYEGTKYPVKVIEKNAFYRLDKLESVTLSEGLETIEAEAFWSCNALKSIELPNSLKEIGAHAFRYCSSLESITIGKGIKTIAKHAFFDLNKLESVTLSEALETIEAEAFWSCNALKSITYTGTKAQWGQVVREVNWNLYSPISVVHCSDGDVAI